MPGQKHSTNKALLLLVVALCLIIGGTFTRSSAIMTPRSNPNMQDMYVAKNQEDSLDAQAFSDPAPDAPAQPIQDVSTPTPAPTQEPTPTAPPEPTPEPAVLPPSWEAAEGVWTPSGSSWYFLVNGSALTGWLTDTDSHRYYFDANGIMQTGWLDDQGIRYYFNGDGVMQTGDAVIDGQVYHFRQDGALEGGPIPLEEAAAARELLFYAKGISAPAQAAAAQEVPSAAQTAPPEDPAQALPTEDAAQAPPAENADPPAQTSPAADAAQVPPAEDASAPQPQTTAVKKVALTFDDGPSDFTDRLLDCLEAHQAKATFFLVGKEVEYFPDPVRRMEALGCEIGNHSYDHTDLATLSPEEIADQIGRTDQLILDLTGHGSTVVRPPYGSVNDTVASSITAPMILWTVDPEDWNEGEDVDRIVQTVMEQVQDGSIILMHDIFRSSVDAAELLIPRLIEEGYELVTIHQLAASSGTELAGGSIYNSFSPAP
ncbi:MAG: polysaccharide deacetylase family protein [Eubacteriales bacterium]|nr:polysaccharide deacetylase family protein [Eubacteriales bacterium]